MKLLARIFLGIIVCTLVGCISEEAQPVTVTPSPTSTPDGLGHRWVRPNDEMVMVFVPGGEFRMGSNIGEADEQPVHTVVLDGYWIDSTEVTIGQYRRCVDAGACRPPGRDRSFSRDLYYGDPTYDRFPVIYVGWHDANTYCEWAEARLPTEAEWEYAACGNEGHRYPWGDEGLECVRANYWGVDGGCVGDTTQVGSYPGGESWCGAYDLAGNVWEWVADVYGEYSAERQENPTGPSGGRYRVMRGGSWFNNGYSMRGANRDRDPAESPYAEGRGFYAVGFRCACGDE